MRIKKIQARTLSEALRQVRQELGENALILSTRTTYAADRESRSAIEVVAAVDNLSAPRPQSARREAEPATSFRRAGRHYASRSYEESMGRIGRNIADFQQKTGNAQTSERIVAGEGPEPGVHQALSSLTTSLRQAGVHYEIIEDFLSHLKQKLPSFNQIDPGVFKRSLTRECSHYIRAARSGSGPAHSPRITVLVGPTGVGKTTTIAKIAARQKIDAKQKVGLISIDTFRIAALDQLRTFAHIAELPLSVAYTPDELLESVRAFAHLDCLLVDTTGRSPRDAAFIRELSDFLSVLPGADILLVLSATTRYAELEDIVRRYAPLGCSGLVFTKVDEVMHPAVMLNLHRLSNLPLYYVTNGQNIPDDLLDAEPQRLAEYLVEHWEVASWIS